MFENGHKNCQISPKKSERLRWEGFVERVSFETAVNREQWRQQDLLRGGQS